MDDQIIIREYIKNDEESLINLMSQFSGYIKSIDNLKRVSYQPDSSKYFVDKMLREAHDNNGKVLVALKDNQIIGFIGGYIKEQSEEELMETVPAKPGYINELFIHEQYRGQGIGKQLMAQMEEYFRNKGCTVIRTSVFSPNKSARALYEKLGFHERDISIVKELK